MQRAAIDLVIFTATENEAEAARRVQTSLRAANRFEAKSATLGDLGGITCLTLCSGLGRRRLDRTFHSLTGQFQPRLIINFGAAGAIAPDLPIGATTVPKECLRFCLPQVECGAGLMPIDVAPLRPSDSEIRFTRAGSGEGEVNDATTRAKLREQLGIDTVDCETYRLASFCRQRGLAFLALRVVTDKADGAVWRDYEASADRVLHNAGRRLQPLAARKLQAMNGIRKT